MGLVVLLKFSQDKYYKQFYRIFGILVMMGLVFTIAAYAYHAIQCKQLFPSAIFWGEFFSLWAFGIAWLRRGVPRK
jgi:hypothetical protein